MKEEEETNERKNERKIGKKVMRLGTYSVGKSAILGMYDPKIPEELKVAEKRKEDKR